MTKQIKTIALTAMFCLISLFITENHINAYHDQEAIYPFTFQIEMIDWDKVDDLIPRYSIFQVVDYETGLSFNVQRRAGREHADVQPLTKKDTLIMKKIYNGKWSWKRRAILVVVDDYLIAASMHGMPHGAGAIRNGFPGHFCIHFYGSKTHVSRNIDLAHHLMILKAAGKLEDYIKQASPTSIIDIFLTAVNQSDPKILNILFEDPEYFKEMNELFKDTEAINRISSFPKNEQRDYMYTQDFTVKVETFSKSKGKERQYWHFVLYRSSLNSNEWRISSVQIPHQETFASLGNETIFINLWTKKLYFVKDKKLIAQYSIAQGSKDYPSPVGTYKIIEKHTNWGGGFGSRWLGLNVPWGIYGIHGTNKPWSIGRSVSKGCIRMHNKDVEELYKIVPKGTVVYIEGPIHEIEDNHIKNLSKGSKGNLVMIIQQRLKAKGLYYGIANGIFGETTEQAVKRLQRKYQLPISGVTSEREYKILGLIE